MNWNFSFRVYLISLLGIFTLFVSILCYYFQFSVIVFIVYSGNYSRNMSGILFSLSVVAIFFWPYPTLAVTEQTWLTTSGKKGEMVVSFVTMGSASTSEIITWGLSPARLSNSVRSSSFVFSDKVSPMRIHVGILTGLLPNTQYYYSVGGNASSFKFTNEPIRPGFGKIYAIFGDLGLQDDYALPSLLQEASENAFDAVVHVGDYAYNLEDDNGNVGNGYMNGIEPIISKYPYYVTPGNHETMADNSFSNYINRFAAVTSLGENSGAGKTNLWYSFDDGLVHWVFVDTELYSYGTPSQIAAQLNWLKADLAKVDRKKTPWLFAGGHKGYWEYPKTDWDSLGLNALFSQYNVDIYFCGHTHNYQRSLPFANGKVSDAKCYSKNTYLNCKGTVGVLAGSPGMSQGLGTRKMPADILALNLQAWGYGHLNVVNSSHVFWNWFEVATNASGRNMSIPWGLSANTDSAWFIKA